MATVTEELIFKFYFKFKIKSLYDIVATILDSADLEQESANSLYGPDGEFHNEIAITSHLLERLSLKRQETRQPSVGDDAEKNEPSYAVGECKLVQPLRKQYERVLKKLRKELTYDPIIPLLGI